MLYNLIVSGCDDAWEGDSFVIDLDRIGEYTSKEFVAKYIKFDINTVNELKKFPCIFAYEYYIKRDPYFGYITDLILRRNDIIIKFEKINVNKFLSYQELKDLGFEFDIGKQELNRTHWAIKNVEFDKIMAQQGIDIQRYLHIGITPINITKHNFDIAVTFAGEYRNYVESTVIELQKLLGKDHVFYDNFYKAQLAQPSLDLILQNIYRYQSKLVVVFLSEEYQEKEWCGLEYRVVSTMIKEKNSNRIMLVKMDRYNVNGIFSTDGYIDGSMHSPRELAGFIVQRLLILL